MPSPVVSGDYCLVLNMTGVGTMYDVASGKELWKARVGGNFSATPLVANGLIYALDEAGATAGSTPSFFISTAAPKR